MPRKSRNLLGEILCHHMVQGINREYIFQTNDEKKKYLELLKNYYLQFEIDIVAYCIMDNHAHLLMYSKGIQNISNFMQQVNLLYAKYYNKKKERVGYVFRNRFESVPIMTREQMYQCIKYIHMNPVKAGIVKKEDQYEYSSYQDYFNRTGFVNDKLLKFVFNSSENYIEKFQKIEYKDLNLHKENFDIEKLFKDFLIKEKVNSLQVRKSKILVQKFINYLISNQYKCSKSEISKVLPISRATLYRWLYEK